MEFTGKIIAVLPERKGVSRNGNEWCAQEYVIESHEQYPKKMCFEVFGQEKISSFNIQIGEEYKVSFDINARQWNDRWINSIRAWKVERATSNASADAVAPAPFIAPEPSPVQFDATPSSTDDLPF